MHWANKVLPMPDWLPSITTIGWGSSTKWLQSKPVSNAATSIDEVGVRPPSELPKEVGEAGGQAIQRCVTGLELGLVRDGGMSGPWMSSPEDS